MITITHGQMEHFRAEMMRGFQAEMCDHLRHFSPPLCKTLDDEQLLAAVKYGIARAGKYGFDMRGPVRLWLENGLAFGSDFDTDPQYPWVAEIVGNRDKIQMHLAESLYEKTVEYRQCVGGERDVLTLRALMNIRPTVDRLPPLSRDKLTESLCAVFTTIYPEKAAYVGERALSRLIDAGVEAGAQRGITEIRGQVLIVVLMYAFGHGCIGDPLYPWIERTLADEKIGDANARAVRLESKALIWLDHVLAYFAE